MGKIKGLIDTMLQVAIDLGQKPNCIILSHETYLELRAEFMEVLKAGEESEVGIDINVYKNLPIKIVDLRRISFTTGAVCMNIQIGIKIEGE